MTETKTNKNKTSTKPAKPGKSDKPEVRGYRVSNPKQPNGVYSQQVELGGVKFTFVTPNPAEGIIGGCLINADLKHIVDEFEKRGFTVEPFYGIEKTSPGTDLILD